MKDDIILEAINGLSRRIEKLDDKIDMFREELHNEIVSVKEELHEEIVTAKEELHEEIENFKNKTQNNFVEMAKMLDRATLSLDKKINTKSEKNDLEHQEFKKILKIS